MTTTRCIICKKKIIESLYKCKCEANVCIKHRFPDQHNCSFDFKKEQSTKLKQTMTKVEHSKIVHI